jgi:ethanolamine utilization protein EutA (predicted chaperonin)
MKKLILELLNKNFDFIVKDWANKIFQSVGDKLTISQIVTYVKRTLNTIIEIIELTDYSKADQYLINTHNLFSDAKLNLLQVSDIFHQGRFAILHCIESDETEEYDSIIILGFIDDIIEQIYARYGMIQKYLVILKKKFSENHHHCFFLIMKNILKN